MRIVSLLPSATEIVFALGLGDELVGVTHECDWPPEAAAIRTVTRSSHDLTLDPRARSTDSSASRSMAGRRSTSSTRRPSKPSSRISSSPRSCARCAP